MTKKKKVILWVSILLAVLLLAGTVTILLLRRQEAQKHDVHDFSERHLLRGESCVEDGIVAYSCSCGKDQLEILPAEGHSLGTWQIVKAPTCQETGEQTMFTSITSTTVEMKWGM